MKNLPSSITTAIAGEHFTTFVLVDMEFPAAQGGTIRLTSLPYDVTVGGNTYTSDGGLEEYSPPGISTVVDREVYRIRIVDNQNVFYQRWNSGIVVGTPVTVRLGVNDNTTDLDIIYKGRIDGVEQDIDFGDNQKTSIIECSGPFADLSLVNIRMTTEDFQKAIDSTDECFDQVGVKVDSAERLWGRKGTTSGGGGGGGGEPPTENPGDQR